MSLKSRLRTLAPRQVRAHRILGGRLRGHVIVTSLHDYPAAVLGTTEQPLLSWFQGNVKSNETWIDVGAHYGYTTIALAELVGRNGHVYAFEPSITTAGYLNRTCQLNRLDHATVVPLGLGNTGNFRAVVTPMSRGMANHHFGGSGSETIYVVDLDRIWPTFGQSALHGVKIDVQGMELQVLEGMTRTLSDYQPKLVIEFHLGVDRDRVVTLLSSLGYRIPGEPLEPQADEKEAGYCDDRSYAFFSTRASNS